MKYEKDKKYWEMAGCAGKKREIGETESASIAIVEKQREQGA
jgi:hypothetical protein